MATTPVSFRGGWLLVSQWARPRPATQCNTALLTPSPPLPLPCPSLPSPRTDASQYIDRHLVLPTSRPTVLAELLQGLDGEAGADPNALFAARRHTLAGTVLSKTALEAAQRHRAHSLSTRYNGGSRRGPGDLPDSSSEGSLRGSLDSNGQPMHHFGSGVHRRRVLNRLRGASGGGGSPPAASGTGAEVQPADVAEATGQTRMPTAADLTDTPVQGFGAACFVRGSVGLLASCPDGVLAFGQAGHVIGEHRLTQSSRRDEVEVGR